MCVISSVCHICVSAHEWQESSLELDMYELSDVDAGNETWVQLQEYLAAEPVPQTPKLYGKKSVSKLFRLNKETWISYVYALFSSQ